MVKYSNRMVMSTLFAAMAMSASMGTAHAETSLKVEQAPAEALNREVYKQRAAKLARLGLSAQVLTLACGPRKVGMPFTAEELAFMVKVGVENPAMEKSVCKMFLNRQSV